MKLESLKITEIINEEELVFINGGNRYRPEPTRGNDTTHNDSLKHDGLDLSNRKI